MVAAFGERLPAEAAEAMRAGLPLGRLCEPATWPTPSPTSLRLRQHSSRASAYPSAAVAAFALTAAPCDVTGDSHDTTDAPAPLRALDTGSSDKMMAKAAASEATWCSSISRTPWRPTHRRCDRRRPATNSTGAPARAVRINSVDTVWCHERFSSMWSAGLEQRSTSSSSPRSKRRATSGSSTRCSTSWRPSSASSPVGSGSRS